MIARRLLPTALATAMLVLASAPAGAQAVPERAERVAAIDWGMAETLIAIGAPPVGLAEIPGYRDWVTDPGVPASVAEIGLRATPNLEFIKGLDADVIVSTPQFASIQPVLEKVAPVLSLEIYGGAFEPYEKAVDATRRLGELVDRQAEAERLIADTERRVGQLAAALQGTPTRKVLVLIFNDDFHVWAFGKGSIYDDVLEKAGLENAWTGQPNFWGFEQTTVDRLVGMEDVAVLVIEPVPPSIDLKLNEERDTSLVGQIDLFREGAYRVLPAVWAFGSLPSAGRFADVLTENADFLKAGNED